MKKEPVLKVAIVLMFAIGTILVLMPFMKTAIVSYLIETRVVHQTSSIPSNVEEKKELIQPPTLRDVLSSYATKSDFSSVGRIVVPEVAINLPIFSNLTNENLFLGSGMMFSSRNPEKENIVLIGHHMSDEHLLFSPLPSITTGSVVYLEYLNKYYQYQVDEVTTVKDTSVEVMNNRGKAEITLITCDRPSITNYRVVVKGHLLINKTEVQVQEQIEDAQTTRKTNKHKSVVFIYEFKWILVILLFVLLLSTYIVRKFI